METSDDISSLYIKRQAATENNNNNNKETELG